MEVVVISNEETRTDSYGNMYFKDIGGGEHKIGAKRPKAVFDLIENSKGMAVELHYKTFNDKKYIDNVILAGEDLFEEKKPPRTTQAKSPDKSFALSYAKDIVVARINNGLINEGIADSVISYAKVFEKYLNS